MRKRGVGTTLLSRAEHAVMLEKASAMRAGGPRLKPSCHPVL